MVESLFSKDAKVFIVDTTFNENKVKRMLKMMEKNLKSEGWGVKYFDYKGVEWIEDGQGKG